MIEAIGYRYVETGNHGSPHEVQGLPAPHSALRASAVATHTTGAERTTQPSSGLAYPPAGEPCVDLVLWRPSGEIVSGGYVSLSPFAARALAEALLAAAREAETTA